MSLQSWQELLTSQQAAGTLQNTFTTAKSVINTQALYVLPAGFWYIGRMVNVKVAGAISNIVTTPGLMNFQVKMGSVAAFDTGNIQLNATAHTTLPFTLDIMLTCRSVGSGTSATLIGQGTATGIMFTNTAAQVDSVQGMQVILAPATAPAAGTGFDSTVSNIVDFFTGFTISNAGNGVQIHQYQLISLN